MNLLTEGLPGLAGARNAASRAAIAIVALVLAACGGGSGTATSGPEPLATCDPADAGTLAECGSVIVAFTDADGDFLNYTVDVVSLTLETANGRVVETLPRETRINFTDYVDLTELVAVASVPPATAAAEPFIVAEVTPVDEKDMRVRGPLIEVDETTSAYSVALRPFHHRHGDFGRMAVQTNDDTEFEING